MIKGTTLLELTDINTGEVDIIKDENMITNALAKILKPLGLVTSGKTMLDTLAPHYKTLLGGILLFDTNLEESEDTLFPPASAKMIGCGSFELVNDTTALERGSYNLVESEIDLDNRYVKYVYDFTTSQANGTIASVCLTSQRGGCCSYGLTHGNSGSRPGLGFRICDGSMQYVISDNTGVQTIDGTQAMKIGTSERLFVLDGENDIAYYHTVDSSTSMRIVKRRAHFKRVSILANPYLTKELIEEQTLTWDDEIPTEYVLSNYDVETKALYVFAHNKKYIEPNEECKMLKISMGNFEVTTYTYTNTSGVRLSTDYGSVLNYGGYVYLRAYQYPFDKFKFELGNSANIVRFEPFGVAGRPSEPIIGCNGRVFYEKLYNNFLDISSGNKLSGAENAGVHGYSDRYKYLSQYTPVIGNELLYFVSRGDRTSNGAAAGFIILGNYLATINNLTEPVTKTADKTMKITYIIQEI